MYVYIVVRKKLNAIFGRYWLRLMKLDWDDIRQVKALIGFLACLLIYTRTKNCMSWQRVSVSSLGRLVSWPQSSSAF